MKGGVARAREGRRGGEGRLGAPALGVADGGAGFGEEGDELLVVDEARGGRAEVALRDGQAERVVGDGEQARGVGEALARGEEERRPLVKRHVEQLRRGEIASSSDEVGVEQRRE